jgi:hypothetical protein
MFEKKQSYTPTEAQRAYKQLNQLVAKNSISSRQAGAYRRHIASRVQVTLKPSYSEQAARRAKAEIVKLIEAGTVTMKSQRRTEHTLPNALGQPDTGNLDSRLCDLFWVL